MRKVGILLALGALFPIACEVYTAPPPQYGARVQVQTPPPPTAQVDVNAQPQPTDPNAVATTDDPNAQTDDADPTAIDDFRNVLAPYGQWVDDPQYGTIWFPSPQAVGADFTPYLTGGHWTYDNDYTWVSDYDWGWAPFHYGRWFVYPGHGWAWIPGKEYAGAWVTWRNGDDGYGYVGWAPTPPNWYYRGGQVVTVSAPWYEPSYEYATTGDLFAPVIRDRIIRDPVRIRTISSRTRVYEAPRGGFVTGTGGIRMHVRGPAPTRLGLNERTLPRVPATARSVVRAQEFARAHPPTVRTAPRTVTPGHPPIDRSNIGRPGAPDTRGRMPDNRGVTEAPRGQAEIRGTSPGRPVTEAPRGQAEIRGTSPGRPVTEAPRGDERGTVMQRGATAQPVPTTTNNPRRPAPPPSVTHRRR